MSDRVRRGVNLALRVDEDEREGFQRAADLCGLTLSGWVRERLRRVAIRELEGAGHEVPFMRAPVPRLKAGMN